MAKTASVWSLKDVRGKGSDLLKSTMIIFPLDKPRQNN